MKSPRPTRGRKGHTSDDAILRQHLVDLLRGGHAHVTFEKAIAGLPARLRGARHPQCPFTPWRLLEHLRIAQWDILEFSRDAKHVSPDWPDGYWPAGDGPAADGAWKRSVAGFRRTLSEMQALVKNPKTNLYARIPHGQGQTILREAMLVADHNSYHLGQFVLLRRLLGAWKDK
jgi:DinB superfamily